MVTYSIATYGVSAAHVYVTGTSSGKKAPPRFFPPKYVSHTRLHISLHMRRCHDDQRHVGLVPRALPGRVHLLWCRLRLVRTLLSSAILSPTSVD